MLLRGFTDGSGGLDLTGFVDVLGERRTWLIVWQTVWMAFAGTALSVLCGVPGAYVLYVCRFPGRGVLRALASVPFVLPTVVVGVAFRALLGKGGAYEFLGLDGTTSAVVLAMVFFNFSVVVRTVGAMWASLDPRATDAARTLGASAPRAFATVTLPALGPTIAGAASVVFLFCSTAYGIVQTLGRPGYGTLETEMWVQTTTYLDLRTAAVLSVLQFVLVGVTLVVSHVAQKRGDVSLALVGGGHRLVRGDVPALVATVVFMVAVIVAPLASLIVRSLRWQGGWSFENYRALSTPGKGFAGGTTVLEAIDHSVRIALDATWIAVLIGVPLAYVLSRRTRGWAARAQRLLDSAVMLPLGVSSVTVGFGFFLALKGGFVDDRGLLVPVAQAVVALPLVVRSLVPVLRAIDPRMREAAATLGAGPARVVATIDGPYVLRGLGLAVGFAFAMSLGEFGATSFLSSPDYVTLPVLIVRLLSRPGAGNYGMAMAGAVVLAVLTAGVMAVCESWRGRRDV
ncbi:iron ABC transporter permease [Arcanobacterium haemolyticum]|nr:iron ABC transporter permease [Arcanobacterium haemolyticum]